MKGKKLLERITLQRQIGDYDALEEITVGTAQKSIGYAIEFSNAVKDYLAKYVN
jgi:uncharacterized protein (UPF0332 family)